MVEKKDTILKDYKDKIKSAVNDLKTPGRRHRQIPNILTVLRMTAPLFIIPAVVIGNVPLIISLIAGFSLTDCIDGFVARKFNLTSELGKDLDAICDKIFASTLLISASFYNPILLCNLTLEGVIAAINTNKKLKGKETKSTVVGKAKTFSLYSLIGAGIITPYLKISNFFNALVATTTTMQLLSIASYIDKPKKKNKKAKENINKSNNEINYSIKSEDDKNIKEKSLEINKDRYESFEKNIAPTLEELHDMKNFLVGKNDIREEIERPKVKRK